MVVHAGTLVDIAGSVNQLRSRATELMSDHARVMASRLQGRLITFSPASVIQDKVNVVGSVRCNDGLSLCLFFTFSYIIASNHMFSYKLNACTFVTCSLNVID